MLSKWSHATFWSQPDHQFIEPRLRKWDDTQIKSFLTPVIFHILRRNNLAWNNKKLYKVHMGEQQPQADCKILPYLKSKQNCKHHFNTKSFYQIKNTLQNFSFFFLQLYTARRWYPYIPMLGWNNIMNITFTPRACLLIKIKKMFSLQNRMRTYHQLFYMSTLHKGNTQIIT